MILIDKIKLTEDNVEDVVNFVNKHDSRFCKLYRFADNWLCIYPCTLGFGERNFYCEVGNIIKAFRTEPGYTFNGWRTKISVETEDGIYY